MYIKNSRLTFSYRLILLILCGLSIISHFSLTDEYNNEKMFSFFTIQSTIFCFIVFFYLTCFSYREMKTKNILLYRYKWILLKEMASHAVLITFLSYRYVLHGNGFSMYSIHEPYLFFKDLFVHFIIPLFVFFDYLLFQPKGMFHFRDCLYNLIFPALYLIMIVIRSLSHTPYDFLKVPRYPYFFLDIDSFGYLKVLLFIGIYLSVILLLSLLMILMDHLLGWIAQKSEKHFM